jgi:hypothetical protein
MRARLVGMQPDSRDRLAALTGVGFIVVGIIAFIVAGEPPAADHPGKEIADWYVDNKDGVEISAFLGTAATGLLVFFAGYLRKVLRSAAGDREMLSLVAFTGFVIVSVGFAVDSTIQFALAERADDIDPTAVSALQALYDFDFFPVILGVLLFLWATGLSVVRTGVFPKWLGWVMIVLGVAAFTPVGFVSAVGSALLVLILSVMLSLRARAAAPV